MILHYPAEDPALRTLCGLPDRTLTVTWQRRAVTCPQCAEQFDTTVLTLRRFWKRVFPFPRPPIQPGRREDL